MSTIAHRDLRNNSSSILRRVAAGESFEVTNNGEVVALLVPAPEDPFDRLVASGKVQRAQSGTTFSELMRTAGISSSDIVDDIRGEW